MPSCRVSEMCEKTVQRPRFTIVSSVYYGRQEIAQFSTILICKILLTQPVPQAGLNTPPAGVYSNQEYLKYSGFELSPGGGKQAKQVFVPYRGVFKPGIFQIFLVWIYTRRRGIQTRFRDRLRTQKNNDLLSDKTSKSAMQNFVVETLGKTHFLKQSESAWMSETRQEGIY